MNRISLRNSAALAGLLALAACGQDPAPPSTQYGSNPQLPPPHQYIMPPMTVPKAVGSRGEDGRDPQHHPPVKDDAVRTRHVRDDLVRRGLAHRARQAVRARVEIAVTALDHTNAASLYRATSMPTWTLK